MALRAKPILRFPGIYRRGGKFAPPMGDRVKVRGWTHLGSLYIEVLFKDCLSVLSEFLMDTDKWCWSPYVGSNVRTSPFYIIQGMQKKTEDETQNVYLTLNFWMCEHRLLKVCSARTSHASVLLFSFLSQFSGRNLFSYAVAVPSGTFQGKGLLDLKIYKVSQIITGESWEKSKRPVPAFWAVSSIGWVADFDQWGTWFESHSLHFNNLIILYIFTVTTSRYYVVRA